MAVGSNGIGFGRSVSFRARWNEALMMRSNGIPPGSWRIPEIPAAQSTDQKNVRQYPTDATVLVAVVNEWS